MKLKECTSDPRVTSKKGQATMNTTNTSKEAKKRIRIDTTNTSKEAKKRIRIVLTDKAPVSIVADDWSLIAKGKDYNGEHECQANTVWEIKVREHADGRRIVYGWKTSGNGGQFIGFQEIFVGQVLDKGEDVVDHIRTVGDAIDNDHLASAVIADLPEEEID